MVEITLFEIHLDGARIDADAEATANAPLSSLSGLLGRGKGESESSSSNPGSATETEVEVAADDDTEPSGPSIGKLLLATVLLAVVAALARRLLGSEDESPLEDVADADIAAIDVGE
jgi:hypothetical protein